MRLFEITRIPDYKKERDWKNFTPYWANEDYSVHDQKGPMEIRVYENQGLLRIVGLINERIMAYLTLMRVGTYYSVQSVQVASEYRGKGVAPYFYDIAISDLGLELVSDSVQTLGGAGIWDKLSKNSKYYVDVIDMQTNQSVNPKQAYSGKDYRFRARSRY